MERLLQYLDDLDDIYGAVGLIAEKLRNVALFLVLLILAAIAGVAGIVLALAKPPLACALAILMFVFLLYRAVTQPIAARTPTYGTA